MELLETNKDEISPLKNLTLSQSQLNKMQSTRERALLRKSRQIGWNGLQVIPDHVYPNSPATSMYWRKIQPRSPIAPKNLRAHTMNAIGSKIYLFGGSDTAKCSNELYVFDTDSFIWQNPVCKGDIPDPVRAHTSTVIGDDLYVFGGGAGSNYFNSIHVLNLKSFIWKTPRVLGQIPGARRAHTACAYKNKLYVIFGGDGSKALDDIFELSIENDTVTWSIIKTTGPAPTPRGYQSLNLLGNKAILFGGSDGYLYFI
eukprot:NODE_99_length_20465_cov_0.827654.p4 type:complete len:257 gc:universal NODE_99_length_20465_cov_0.827654:10782-10012(-)